MSKSTARSHKNSKQELIKPKQKNGVSVCVNFGICGSKTKKLRGI